MFAPIGPRIRSLMHCLKCGALLAETIVLEHGRPSRRLRCTASASASACDYVHYNNPTPVVGCIVEAEGKGVLLVQNIGWPSTFFGVVTGFLEADDVSPASAMLRELKEEIGVSVTEERLTLVGRCGAARMVVRTLKNAAHSWKSCRLLA